MIVPGSHRQTYGVSAKMTTQEELDALHHDPIGMAGIDTSQAIEVRPNDGDLLIFNPMCLHSASGNASTQPRYVYFSSFYDTSATEFAERMREIQYSKGFPDSLREALPEEMLPLLDPKI
jgi:ectoine hydroxylase-related dioxygenase (phytanoyl-CoA dioxygenase family)